jgi:hypothetical protein
VLAYNVLSVVKTAVEASHDLEATNMQVSTYYIAAGNRSPPRLG